MKKQDEPVTQQQLTKAFRESEARMEKRMDQKLLAMQNNMLQTMRQYTQEIVSESAAQILNVMAMHFERMELRMDRFEERLRQHDLALDDHGVRIRYLEAHCYDGTAKA